MKPCRPASLKGGRMTKQAPKRGRGRPALGEELKRSRVVKLYMRPEELAELSSRAEARGLSVSEYLRRRALGLRLPTE